jgi:hypothetical protein
MLKIKNPGAALKIQGLPLPCKLVRKSGFPQVWLSEKVFLSSIVGSQKEGFRAPKRQ